MKFIHCADLHLDQPFRGLGQPPKAFRHKLTTVNQSILTDIVDRAIEEAVDLVLIVGDTFHQPVPTIQTQRHVIEELERLNEQDIPVVLSFGNHDYYQADKYWFDFPENTHCLTSIEVTTTRLVTKSHETIAVSGFSYESPGIEEEMAKKFPQRASNVDYHLGLYHGQLGHQGQHPYAPFQLNQLKELNYDYWALGHIHKSDQLASSPMIVYPGTPIGHTKKETETEGFVMVEFSGSEPAITWYRQSGLLWQTRHLNISSVTTLPDLLPFMIEEVGMAFAEGAHLICLELLLIDPHSGISHQLQDELQRGELLTYLQEVIYQNSSGRVWLYGMTEGNVKQAQLQWPVGLSQEKINDALSKYRDQQRFSEELQPLFRQSELRQLFDGQPNFKEQTIQHAKKVLGIGDKVGEEE